MSAVDLAFDVFTLVMAVLFIAIGVTIAARNRQILPRAIGVVVALVGALLALPVLWVLL